MANLKARDEAPPEGASGPSPDPVENDGSHGALARVYQSLVLPHLGSSPNGAETGGVARGLSASDLDDFCELLTKDSIRDALAFLDSAAARGVDFEALLLGLLAGAATRLGADWQSDRRPFAGVTVGMSRLQEALQHVSLRDPTRPLFVEPAGSAVLAPCPGEQHNFGVLLLDAMLHRAGWRMHTLTETSQQQLGRLVANEAFDLIGLSASTADMVGELQQTIQVVRRMSTNRNIKVIVGGHLFVDDPGLVAHVDADAAPADLRAAIRLAENFRHDGQNRAAVGV